MTTRPVVLAVSAHPDDVEIGCGGALLRWSESWQIGSSWRRTASARGEHRVTEAQRAANALGARLELLGRPDGRLGRTVDLIEQLERIGSNLRPARVLAPAPNDSHQDHRQLARAAVSAFRTVPELLFYESLSTTRSSRTYFTDVAATIDRQVRSARAPREPAGQPRPSRATSFAPAARYWSMKARRGEGYFEAFEPYRLMAD